MLLCSTDIFLPTPDSLLVNLNECKEVGISCLVLSCRFRIMSCEPWTETREWENLTERVLILSSQPVNVYNPVIFFQLVQDLLKSLPTLFEKTMETQSALGSALQAGFKLLSPTGGRMTVFQTQLPNLGAGALQSREDPNQRASAKVRAHTCAGYNT